MSENVSDESVQIIHLRLCRRAQELNSPIAALEEAAEEIAELTQQVRLILEQAAQVADAVVKRSIDHIGEDADADVLVGQEIAAAIRALV